MPQITKAGPISGLDGSWYQIDGRPVPRVSSLLDGVRSPELERYQRQQLWAGFEAGLNYEAATMRSLEALEAAAQVGTAIHTLIELGTKPPRSVANQVMAAGTAMVELFAEIKAAELTVAKLTADGFPLYAGTLDVLGVDRRTGSPALGDWKSGAIGQRVFLRHALQLAAYAEATHYAEGSELVPFDDRPMVGFVVGLEAAGTYTSHRLDLSPMSTIGEQLRSAIAGLESVWRLRDTYGQGSAVAETQAGGEAKW